MNIYDIANRANVSIATVSRVINNSPKVSEKTRKKVLDIVDELGFTPNVFARGLGLNTMKTIGILCSDPSDIYVAGALSCFEKMLRKNGYDSLLCCSGYDTKNLKKYMDILISKSVDAVIMIGSKYISSRDNKNLIKTTAKSLPIFLINGSLTGENIYCAYYDDLNATKKCANMLYKAGKRKLLFLYNSTSQSAKRKLDGFMKGCKEYEHSGALEDLSIIGYNNSIFSKVSSPELTTVDSRLFDLCSHSVNTLLKVFDGQSPKNITVFEPVIIERDTFRT